MSEIDRRDFLKLSGGAAAGICGLQALAQAAEAAPDSNLGQQEQEVLPSRSYEPSTEVIDIYLAAPSTVRIGEKIWVGVKMLAQPYYARLSCFTRHYPTVSSSTNVSPRGTSYMDNVPPEWKGTLEIMCEKKYTGPKQVSFADGIGPYPHDHRPIKQVGPFVFEKPGVYFLKFRDRESGIAKSSNPIVVDERLPSERLYWGDIHAHTILTDAIRSPEEVYYFGRDEAFLDVCALSEHTEFYLTDTMWDYLTNVTNDFNQAGRFVTLVAQEWTNFRIGHRNIYHRGDSAPFIRATDKVYSQLSNLFRFAREHSALVVPHHSAAAAMGVDWSQGHDPEVERLVEIYSSWGNSERPSEEGNLRAIKKGIGGEKKGSTVKDALKLGRRYGFIGSGDIHDGRLGDTLMEYHVLPKNYRHGQRGGLVGIWSERLTREAVFDALWNRRVFGTSGPRIFLRFSMNGHPMGSIIRQQAKLKVSVKAMSEVPVSSVDLVRNGEDFLSAKLNLQEVTWEKTVAPSSPSDSFYVRITREDGEMAWSSPIWVESS